MIGIVVVSHSHALAVAAIEVASLMVPEGSRPVVLPAAGLGAGAFGTDAAQVAEAVAAADGGEGVLVLVDLGSAVLSAEMALEFVDPDVAGRVLLSPAPLVEGLVAAVVAAAAGAGLAECEASARGGLRAKQDHLGRGAGGVGGRDTHLPDSRDTNLPVSGVTMVSVAPPGGASVTKVSVTPPGGASLTWSTTIDLAQGLHARPAASMALALSGLDATVSARNPRTGRVADAASVVELMSLDLRDGDVLEATITGPDAAAARSALERAAAERFGDLR